MSLFGRTTRKNKLIIFKSLGALVSHSLQASKLIMSVLINSLINQANGQLPKVTGYI